MTEQTYKNLGTIRKATKAETGGESGYFFKANGENRMGLAPTLKEAREGLELAAEHQREIRRAVNLLESSGYKVYKEINTRSFD
jgi:H2-forming N5,N10-methylenetetrahydromethanopterin dehydrogenase-like enzyme